MPESCHCQVAPAGGIHRATGVADGDAVGAADWAGVEAGVPEALGAADGDGAAVGGETDADAGADADGDAGGAREAASGAGEHAATTSTSVTARPAWPSRSRQRTAAIPYPIVRIRRGFAIVIWSISAWLTPRSRRRGRKVSARYVYPLPS